MNADAASGHEGTFLVVVYDRYEDARRFVPLEGALQQIEDLAGELRPFGYRPMVLANPDQDELAVGLGRWAKEWRGGGQHGPAVVAWSGHAEVTAEGDLQLITRGTQNLDDDEDYFTAERLTNRALSGRADQILILLDTCHAGAGAPGALKKALTSMAQRTLPEPRRAWLGVLAACRAHEHAEGAQGLLVETVLQVLRHGPTRDGALPGGRYRHEWSVRNKGISGETLALAVMEDWPESGQIPVRASAGTPEPMFRNPLWRPNAREALVEHLVLAARGIDPTEEGWFFTGRHRILREITDWLAEGRAGLLLLTGKAGSGKSAVVGRIAALSHPEERRAILMHAPLSKDDPDPGENSVDAALHLRGMRLQDMAEALAAKLGLPAPETPAGLIAALEGLEARGARRHVLVLDGLDEAASEQAGLIADQLLVPLSRLCTVLLASRDRPFQPHHEPGETLNAALTRTVGSTVRVLDLDEEEDTAGDIAVYVRSRLVADGVSRATADNIAPVLALRATGGDGGFLFARVVASSLARNLAADPDRPWREQIPEGITDAFDRDLAPGAALHRDGRLLPHAADDLLTALAWGAGNGMPAHGVWETVAKAVSHDGTVYGPEDIDWVLMNYGRYIVEDSDGHQAVYRLYHRELIGHLQRRGASDVTEGRTPAPWTVIHELAALVLRQTGNGTHPQEANPYLRRHLADHALPATNVGIAVLRQLVEANAQAYMHVLASALNDLSVLCKEAELPFDAVGLAAEAVGIHRGLAESDPAAHLADLADSLNNLATHLGEAGRRLKAVEPAREAVDLRRRLAQDNPEAHLADLAVSLNNLSSLLSDVGRRDEALAAVEEATSLHRGLALDSPATRLPYLAASLSNLASQLSEAGRWEEGAQAMEEAASLFDEFTHPRPRRPSGPPGGLTPQPRGASGRDRAGDRSCGSGPAGRVPLP
ncbi:tetratricopeptide repeat protein [Streptomyces sp. SS7]|uniref:tetratricopeptide repeat protein n=1 Tax=Streptomyces sp. SS7 TaxID=3108485 RepID=UPI0030EEB1E2